MTVWTVIFCPPSGGQRLSFTLPPSPPRRPSLPFQLVLVVMLVLLRVSWSQRGAVEVTDPLIPELAHSIEKASVFFHSYQDGVNIDGLFGIQLGQGQLLSIEEILSKVDTGDKLGKKMKQVISRMETVVKGVLNRNQKYEASYTQRFMQMVAEPLKLPWVPHWLAVTHRPVSFEKLQNYDEEFGDDCLARVIGSYIQNNKDNNDDDTKQLPKCSVTKECLDFMTKPNTTGYYLSHQLLYFICLQMYDCAGRDGFEQFQERPTVADMERHLCGRMYNEAEQLAMYGYVDTLHQDLFAEHIFLCAPLGFQNFLRADWIEMVMTWQSPIGCFAETTVDNALYATRSSPTMRKLMREQLMENGCLSHKSGLCYGVLTIYLNGLLRRQLNHS